LNNEGVTFDEVQAVLLDPYTLTRENGDADNEHRFISLGMGAKGRILIVVWTLREEFVRLISAWHGALWVKANRPQRRVRQDKLAKDRR
jgi:uncharacterized DUF497 family protein